MTASRSWVVAISSASTPTAARPSPQVTAAASGPTARPAARRGARLATTARPTTERLPSRPCREHGPRREARLRHAEVRGLLAAEPAEVVLDRPEHRALEVEDARHLAREADRLPVEQRVGPGRL